MPVNSLDALQVADDLAGVVYAVYLKWMQQSARALDAEPDELELTLFTLGR